MATLNDSGVRELLEQPNYAVISTVNPNGSIHSTVVWVGVENGSLTVNSARGRVWPRNLERDPHASVVVFESGDPYNFVEIRGTAEAVEGSGDAHIDSLAKKYLGVDEYPYRRPGEERVKYLIKPDHIRHVHQ
jgi:PPOX class probable F420-dependent enzyme